MFYVRERAVRVARDEGGKELFLGRRVKDIRPALRKYISFEQ